MHECFHLLELGSNDVPIIYFFFVLSQCLLDLLHLNSCFLLESCAIVALFGLDMEVVMIADSTVAHSALLPIFLFKTRKVFCDFLDPPFHRAIHSIFILFQLTFQLNASLAAKLPLYPQLYLLQLIATLVSLQPLH